MREACRSLIKNLTAGESSQGMVECGFVVALVAVTIVPLKSLAESFVAVVKIVSLFLSSI